MLVESENDKYHQYDVSMLKALKTFIKSFPFHDILYDILSDYDHTISWFGCVKSEKKYSIDQPTSIDIYYDIWINIQQ